VVDKDGKVIVKSASDGTEGTVIDQLGAESIGLGHIQPILTHRMRPREIEVLFTREHEVRFDFEESSAPTTTEDQRYMDNVLPIPDYKLQVKSASGQATGSTLCQGTWTRFPTAFNSWGAPPRQPALTNAGAWYAFTRRAMIPYMDLWTQCGQNGIRDPDADWMARLGAIQTYFRRMFRINSRWMARILQLKAEKKATIDPATGTRAPALAYADHARISGMRSDKVYIASGLGSQIPFAVNVRSSPDSAGANFDYPPAPCEVSIVDHDQGIVGLDFKADIYRLHEMLLPSMVQSGSGEDGLGKPLTAGPTANIDDHKTAIAFNAISTTAEIPQLTAEHRVAIVLTAVPAGTNNKEMEQFEKIVVTPAMVKKLLPTALQKGLDSSVGPKLQLRVNPTLETARVAWVNTRSTDIEAAFGIGTGKPVTDLIVNLKGNAHGGASCQAIAEALAARTWALLTDRLQGSATARLSAETTPSGHIESVGHEVTPLGAVQTSITLPGQLEPIDMFSLMPESTRRLVLRMLPSPGKVAK